MAWTAVYESATGRLESVGQIVADPLPVGFEAVVLPGRPESGEMWDAGTRWFVSRPIEVLIDRIQDLTNDPVLAAVWTRLTVSQRQVLRDRLIGLLGPYRLRSPNHGVDFV